jgi:proton-translocating NADH-quinone oxidoreductase chain N
VLAVNVLLVMGVFTLLTPILGYLGGKKIEVRLGYWTIINFVVTLFYVLFNYAGDVQYIMLFISPISSSLRFDGLSFFFTIVFLIVGIAAAIHSISYMERDRNLTIYYTLMQIMVMGLIGITVSDDLFTFFVFWEVMAISSYVLVAFRYHLDEPVEAGMKYIIMSGVGSLLLLYGISYVYGVVGGLQISDIYLSLSYIVNTGFSLPVLIVSLFLIGFGIKAAYFPFWTWLPDAHPAAPSPISALLSGIVIKAGIVGIVRFALPYIIVNSRMFAPILFILSAATMTVANLIALMQDDIKRLLAYSSIVNIGFILIGLAAAGYGAFEYGVTSSFTHVLSHALGKGLAFLAVGGIIYSMETREIRLLEGFGRRHPIVGVSLAIAMLSLAGMPPLPGFWSKWFLILSALSVDLWILALLGVFNSVLAVLYYLWIIQRMFLSEPTDDVVKSHSISVSIKVSLLFLVAIMVLLGVFPQLLYYLAHEGASALFM